MALKKIYLILCICALTLFMGNGALASEIEQDLRQSVTSVNLISNGDFEAGNVAGWSSTAISSIYSADKYAGNYCMRLFSSNSWWPTEISFTVERNTDYAVSYYAKNINERDNVLFIDNAGVKMILRGDGNTMMGSESTSGVDLTDAVQAKILGCTAWKKQGFYFNSGNATNLKLTFVLDITAEFLIDDLSVTPRNPKISLEAKNNEIIPVSDYTLSGETGQASSIKITADSIEHTTTSNPVFSSPLGNFKQGRHEINVDYTRLSDNTVGSPVKFYLNAQQIKVMNQSISPYGATIRLESMDAAARNITAVFTVYNQDNKMLYITSKIASVETNTIITFTTPAEVTGGTKAAIALYNNLTDLAPFYVRTEMKNGNNF